MGDKCLYPQKSSIFVSINIYPLKRKGLGRLSFFRSLSPEKSGECLRYRIADTKKRVPKHSTNFYTSFSSFSKTTFIPISHPLSCLSKSSTLSEKLLFRCCVNSSSFEISLLNLRYLRRELSDSLAQF